MIFGALCARSGRITQPGGLYQARRPLHSSWHAAFCFHQKNASQVTTQRKTREIVLAAEITRKYSKDEILELYLNEIYYGNIAYGIEAAAETDFNTSADQLNLAQASFVAGLPQAPAIYDVFTNREGALLRHQDVVNLMYQLSSDRNCIKINQWEVPICIKLDEAVAAVQEIENYPFAQRPVNMPFPHWVNFIRMQLEAQFDPQTIYRSGFKVFTTLDPELQNYAQSAVKAQVEKLVDNDATDGALVAIRPQLVRCWLWLAALISTMKLFQVR